MESDSVHFLSPPFEFYDCTGKSSNVVSTEPIRDRETPPKKAKGESTVECPVCFVTFTQRNNLGRHMRRLHGAEAPRSYLKNKIDFSLPECPECEVKFTRKSNLLRHLKKFHEYLIPKPPQLPKIFSCTECDTKFTKWSNCLRHMRNFHPRETSQEEDKHSLESKCTSTGAEDNLVCVIEVDPFPVISPLRVEVASSKPTECSQESKSSENRLCEPSGKHESGAVNNVKLMCIECNIPFSTPFNLRRHIKRFHPELEDDPQSNTALRTPDTTTAPADCPLSDFRENRRFFQTCHECNVSFSTPFNLRRHMKRFHPRKGANDCAFQTAQLTSPESRLLGDLLKDRLVLLACDQCDASFSTASNKRRHMRKFHAEAAPPSRAVALGRPAMVGASETKKCPLCEFRESRPNLYVHLNLVHGLHVIIEYQVFDSEAQLDQWLAQVQAEAEFTVRKSDASRMVISCSQLGADADGFCPAEMEIVTERGKCTVHYVKTHVGHEPS